VAQYRYDSLNRISQIVDDDDTVSYSWDSCINGIGRLCSVSNAASSLSYRYDSHGRITGKTQTAGGAPLAVSHTYNSAGQRTQTVTPGGQTIDYQWSGGRLTALSVNGQPVLSQIGYEPDGQVNGWVWGNNQPNERFYDLAGRPVIVSLGVDAKTQQPDSRTLGYDAAGLLTTAINDSDPSLNQQHAYDELDRLTSSERGEPVQSRTNYSYDLSGNRTGKTQDNTAVTNGTIDANSNRLQSQSGAQAVHYSYDLMGNLTGDGTVSYSYNAAGRRIGATAANLNARYTYNALGQRVTKTVNGTTRQFVYDEQGHLTGEYDSAGQLLQEIVWLGDLPVAALKPSASAATPDLYYLHADHLSTPRAITRPGDNQVVWTWESEAFGNSLPDQNPSGLGSFVFNLRFPGQYYDQETGLHYNVFRDYDPSTGRYSESDPIGLAGGINTYSYVYNNPLRYTDPLGLIAGVDDAIEVAAVAEAAAACAANPACAAAATEVATEATAASAAVGAAAASAGKYCLTQLHHAWPKYLGGPAKQALVELQKSLHDAYHSGLDKILPRQWGKSYYDNLTGQALEQAQRDLASYTQAFDAKYGTQLYESMIKNGFVGK
jgi:RHS repeat-associated protein